MITKVITYLSDREELAVSLALTYFIFILSMHDYMVNLSVNIMNSITREKYDLIIGAITAAALLIIIISFIRNLISQQRALNIKIIYMMLIIGLVILHIQMNFVMNIEIIHTLQFAVLALLIFPITKSYGSTLYYTMLLGFVDELFQYAVLYPHKNDYLDFNDIVLDQIGAALMLIYIFSTWKPLKTNPNKNWYLSPVFISATILVSGIALLFHLSLIALYHAPENKQPVFLLNKGIGNEPFWRHLPNCDIVYHVMTPQEGILAIAGICSLFFLLDYLDRRIPVTEKSEPSKVLNLIHSNGNGSVESQVASSVFPLSR